MKKLLKILVAAIILGMPLIHMGPAMEIQQAMAVQPKEQNEKVFKTVTPDQAKNLIDTRKEILVVDIRSPQELTEGVIEGSTLIPLWDVVKRKKTIPQDRPVMLICAVGGRSLTLGKLLSANGYPEIYNLKGGISAWKKAGLPLVY